MADITYGSLKTSQAEGLGARIKSFFSRAFKAVVEAREREARRLVAQYVTTHEDYVRKDLKRVS